MGEAVGDTCGGISASPRLSGSTATYVATHHKVPLEGLELKSLFSDARDLIEKARQINHPGSK